MDSMVLLEQQQFSKNRLYSIESQDKTSEAQSAIDNQNSIKLKNHSKKSHKFVVRNQATKIMRKKMRSKASRALSIDMQDQNMSAKKDSPERPKKSRSRQRSSSIKEKTSQSGGIKRSKTRYHTKL